MQQSGSLLASNRSEGALTLPSSLRHPLPMNSFLSRDKPAPRPKPLPAASFSDTVKQIAVLLEQQQPSDHDSGYAELTTEFLVCYKRFAAPATLFRILQKELAKNRHSKGLLRFLYLWVDAYFLKDFWRVGHRRIGRLLRLLVSAHARSPELQLEANRVKLLLLRKHREITSQLTAALREVDVLKNLASGKDQIIERFFDFHPRDIAEQLTLLEYSIFRSIEPEEFYNKGWTNEKKAPNLRNLVQRADQVSYWVASNILCQVTLTTQLRAVNRFVLIAQWCEQMGNYNSLMEILGGFCLWAVSRLKRTWPLEKKYQILLRHLETIMSPTGNYSNYRKILAKRAAALAAGVPTLPYLGLFLKDLTFIEDGNSDMVDEKRLNFDKIAMIGETLRTIHAYQNVDYNRKIKGRITALLRHLASLPRLSEEELNRLSERLKPLKLLDTGSGAVAVAPSSSSDSFSLTDGSSSDDDLNHAAAAAAAAAVVSEGDSPDASEMIELSMSEHSDAAELLRYIPVSTAGQFSSRPSGIVRSSSAAGAVALSASSSSNSAGTAGSVPSSFNGSS